MTRRAIRLSAKKSEPTPMECFEYAAKTLRESVDWTGPDKNSVKALIILEEGIERLKKLVR